MPYSAGLTRLCQGLLLLCMLCCWGLAERARAQSDDLYAPAIVVNDALITEFDIQQRVRLIGVLGAPATDARRTAIEMLIEDRLRAQAAREAGVALTDEQIEAALEEFARQRNMSASQMLSRLSGAGISRQAMVDLLGNQAAFREAMRLRFLARSTPTDTEIETEQVRGLQSNRISVRLGELVIPIQERGAVRTAALAEELYQSLNDGADFTAAVRSYSRAPTARRGGEVGWVPIDRLPPQIGSQIALLQPGQVTRPIDVPNAVVFLKLLEIREDEAPALDPSAVRVTIGRLIIPLRQDPSETDIAAAAVEAEQLGNQISSCADVEARRNSYEAASGIEGPMALSDLPDAQRTAIAPLAVGQVSPPVRVPTGIAVIVVCAKIGDTDVTSIEQIRGRMISERMTSFAQGYLQELRRDAVIEYR
ncbi:MAG: peptidylprolyl isomerase [Pseudomonadota bacterium]